MSETIRELKEQFERDLENDTFLSIKPHGIEYNETYENVMSMVESIQEDRQSDYGDAGKSHDNIAEMWTSYLQRKGYGVFIDRTDVAIMMMLMKTSRFAFSRKLDSILDMAAYADFALKFMDEHETKANTR